MTGTGGWLVDMPEIGASPRAGNVQVTAVNARVPARCQVASWASEPSRQLIGIRCHNAGSLPLNTGWTVSYQRGRAITGVRPPRIACTMNNKPLLSAAYVPLPAGVNVNSKGAVNHIHRAGLGLWLVSLPSVGLLPDDVLVPGYQVGPGFCNLNGLWGTAAPNVVIRDVACLTSTGKPKNEPSLITYTAG